MQLVGEQGCGDLVALLRDQLHIEDPQISELLQRDKEHIVSWLNSQGI
jgi:hypothetical protein